MVNPLPATCRYFHIFAFVSSAIPLAFGYPAPAVMPSWAEAALLLAIACGSFSGNLLVNRAFQLELAAKASAVNFSQVGELWALQLPWQAHEAGLTGLVCRPCVPAAWATYLRDD